MIDGRRCRQHRPALLDFVDRGEILDSTGAALAHLNRCPRCTAELEATMLTITALRRLGAEVARVEPSPDAWPRLRARIGRWSWVRWAIHSPTTGIAMSVALVALLVVPLRLGMTSRAEAPSPIPGHRSTTLLAELRVERNYIANTHQVSLPAFDTVASPAGLPRTYPDGIRPTRKEVSPAGPSGRPPEAI